MFCSSTW